MNNSIPTYLVHLTASCLMSRDGPHPNRKMTVPVTGILFGHGNRRCVIGAATKRFITDGLALSAVFGVGDVSGSGRKALNHPFSVELASVGMFRSYECAEQRWALLGDQIHKNELPGRYDGNEFVPASPIPLPPSAAFTKPCIPVNANSEFAVFGVRKTGAAMETVVVPTQFVQAYHQGVVVSLVDADIHHVEFGGAPILDHNNRLIAMGLFVGKLTSGSLALVGLSIPELVSRAGIMIESLF